jgi:hypothetical protein
MEAAARQRWSPDCRDWHIQQTKVDAELAALLIVAGLAESMSGSNLREPRRGLRLERRGGQKRLRRTGWADVEWG